MTIIYYRDDQNNFIGGYGEPSVPPGTLGVDYFEVPFPPTHGAMKWGGSDWYMPYYDWLLTDHREKNLNVSVTTELVPLGVVELTNDERTKAALGDKIVMMTSNTEIATMSFKANNGWFSLNIGNYQDLRLSLDMYTQKVYDAVRFVEEKHAVTPYVSWEEAKEDFDNIMEE